MVSIQKKRKKRDEVELAIFKKLISSPDKWLAQNHFINVYTENSETSKAYLRLIFDKLTNEKKLERITGKNGMRQVRITNAGMQYVTNKYAQHISSNTYDPINYQVNNYAPIFVTPIAPCANTMIMPTTTQNSSSMFKHYFPYIEPAYNFTAMPHGFNHNITFINNGITGMASAHKRQKIDYCSSLRPDSDAALIDKKSIYSENNSNDIFHEKENILCTEIHKILTSMKAISDISQSGGNIKITNKTLIDIYSVINKLKELYPELKKDLQTTCNAEGILYPANPYEEMSSYNATAVQPCYDDNPTQNEFDQNFSLTEEDSKVIISDIKRTRSSAAFFQPAIAASIQSEGDFSAENTAKKNFHNAENNLCPQIYNTLYYLKGISDLSQEGININVSEETITHIENAIAELKALNSNLTKDQEIIQSSETKPVSSLNIG